MKLLICVGDGIGNIIMTTPMIRSLYELGHTIDILGSPNFFGGHHILRNRPEINNVFDIAGDASGYDRVIATVGGVKALKSLHNVKEYLLTPANYEKESEIENYMAIAREFGWEGETPDCFCGLDGTNKVSCENRPLIGLHNGHHTNPVWARKAYPHFKELCGLIESDIIIFGSSIDKEDWMDEYQTAFDLPLLDVADVISSCDIFIGTDSGLTHMASALGTKTYAIWGATSLSKNKPPKANIIRNNKCEPCQEFHPGWELEGRWGQCKEWICMDIKPEVILESITSISAG